MTLPIRITTLTSLFAFVACGDPATSDDTSPTTSTSDTPTSTDPTTSTTAPADSSTGTPDDTTTSAEVTTSDTGTDDSSSGDDASSDDGSTTAADGIEIVGSWTDGFGTHDVDDTTWTTTFGEDVFSYTISQYDNRLDFAIAQDDGDETWTRYDWTWVGADLWYCQTAFGLPTEDAAFGTPAADANDPEMGGCGPFPWSALTPL